MRLDKLLSNQGYGSRSKVKIMIHNGLITVNGMICKNDKQQIKESEDEVFVGNEKINYHKYSYFMLNKPAGVISATKDDFKQTVMDLILENSKDLFPVGRLDIDTEGLLLITNNGKLAHHLLSPKKHVIKKYLVKFTGSWQAEYAELFKRGIILENGYQTKPAIIEKITTDSCYISIYEGKFHQIKRMFKVLKMEVIYLKRITFGPLCLDDQLSIGAYRKLTDKEIQALEKIGC